MITTSEAIDKISPALANAFACMENAAKSSTNPHFRSKYADLAEVLNTIRPVLAENALSLIQSAPLMVDGHVLLDTMLLHSSGQWIRTQGTAPLTKDDAQGVGSVTTYLRRYSAAALCGVAQEDDDGNAAQKPSKAARATQEARITADQAKAIRGALSVLGKSEDAYVQYLQVRGVEDIAASQFDRLMGQLSKLVDKQVAAGGALTNNDVAEAYDQLNPSGMARTLPTDQVFDWVAKQPGFVVGTDGRLYRATAKKAESAA